MRNSKANQRMTLLTLVVALGAAVYLNWEYARNTELELDAEATAASPADAIVVDALETDTESADKNYGEAQLVSVGEVTGEKFFEEARETRTKTRDDALDKLQKMLRRSKLTGEEKEELTKKLSETIDHIAAESEVESLVKAKGFVDCVAYIDADKVNLTVMTTNDGLTKEEVAQIRDIVLSKCNVSAKDITVVEVK